MSKISKQRQAECRDKLRELCPPGTTVYTILRHVSRSGMMRHIDCYIMQNNTPRWITRLVADLLDYRMASAERGVKVPGAGMDMGFHVVYALAATLYPDGFECLSERCRSNDHSNGDRDRTPHHHASGGYALNHEWI